MYVSHNLGLFAGDELPGFVVGVSLAPIFLKAHDVRAIAFSHLRKAIGEISVGKYRQLRSGIDEVGDGGFHARAPGAGNYQRCAASSVGGFEQLLNVAHDLDEVRIEMPDNWLRQSFINPWMNHTGPWPE